jgi:hypothetical protein
MTADQYQFFLNSSLELTKPIAFISFMTHVIEANAKRKALKAHSACKEPVQTYQVVMFFPKNFYLIDSINSKISNFLSSGIMSHLIEKYVDLRYWNVKTVKKGPQKLTVKHLRGAFNLWVILSVFSSLIFMMEVFLKREII